MMLSELWRLLDAPQRWRLVGLQLLSICAAFSTVGGLAAVIPFFTALADPAAVGRSAMLGALLRRLRLNGHEAPALALGLAFAAAVLLANAVNLLALLAINRFALEVGDSLYVRLFEEYLHRGWERHARSNSAELAARLLHDAARVASGVLQHGLLVVTNIVTVAFILGSIMLLNPPGAGAALLALGASYGAIYLAVRRRLLRNGELESRYDAERTRTVAEGLSAVRELALLDAQPHFLQRFAAQCRTLSRSAFSTFTIAQSPRCALESATMCCLVALALYLRGLPGGAAPWMARLSFTGLAAYRLLPALQQVFASMVRIRADRPALAGIGADLARPSARTPPARHAALCSRGALHRELRLHEVTFRYAPERAPAVANVSIAVPAGAVVGLVGPNGSGKTTLLDLVSGLLTPQSGRIEVDGMRLDERNRRSWQSVIAYVSQRAVLLDASLAENIALGVAPAHIDRARLERAARIARLGECIDSLPEGYEERVGEHGCRLSGGQRQRLAVARALYRDATLLLLDEATSALDAASEAQLLESLVALDPRPTILLVAHQKSALRHCEVIYELERGAVVRVSRAAERARCSAWGAQHLPERATFMDGILLGAASPAEER